MRCADRSTSPHTGRTPAPPSADRRPAQGSQPAGFDSPSHTPEPLNRRIDTAFVDPQTLPSSALGPSQELYIVERRAIRPPPDTNAPGHDGSRISFRPGSPNADTRLA